AGTPGGSMLRQLTPRPLVPRLRLYEGPEGPQTPSRNIPAASPPANVPTPSRSRSSLCARSSREADASASVAAPETQSSELAETEVLMRRLLEEMDEACNEAEASGIDATRVEVVRQRVLRARHFRAKVRRRLQKVALIQRRWMRRSMRLKLQASILRRLKLCE
ncbi:unnamed protein product, partial [Polarella glacialis]